MHVGRLIMLDTVPSSQSPFFETKSSQSGNHLHHQIWTQCAGAGGAGEIGWSLPNVAQTTINRMDPSERTGVYPTIEPPLSNDSKPFLVQTDLATWVRFHIFSAWLDSTTRGLMTLIARAVLWATEPNTKYPARAKATPNIHEYVSTGRTAFADPCVEDWRTRVHESNGSHGRENEGKCVGHHECMKSIPSSKVRRVIILSVTSRQGT